MPGSCNLIFMKKEMILEILGMNAASVVCIILFKMSLPLQYVLQGQVHFLAHFVSSIVLFFWCFMQVDY